MSKSIENDIAKSKSIENEIENINLNNVCKIGIDLKINKEYTLDEIKKLFLNTLIKYSDRFFMAQSYSENYNNELIVNSIRAIKSRRKIIIGRRKYFYFEKQTNGKYIFKNKIIFK